MMPSEMCDQINDNQTVTNSFTTRIFLTSFLHLMTSLYGQKSFDFRPDVLFTGDVKNVTRQALVNISQKIDEARAGFIAKAKMGSLPTSNNNGFVIRNLFYHYKAFANKVVNFFKDASQQGNQKVVDDLIPHLSWYDAQ